MFKSGPSPSLLEAALEYVENDFHVFPCKPKSKVPLTPNGFKDASNDPEQIRAWWAKHPNANIGIATGSVSGIFVIDVDGDDLFGWPPIPNTLRVKTSKGFHYYIKCPKDLSIKCRTNINGYNVDIRGDGGYVVAPPSVHPDGERYEFSD